MKSPSFPLLVSAPNLTDVEIVAPHDIREKTWDILGFLYDLGIFDKKGGVPTKISIKAFPGYEGNAAYSLTATALYLASSEMNFQQTWQISTEDLIKAIQANLKFSVVADLSLDPVWVELMHLAFIQKTARRQLDRAYEKSFEGLGFRTGVIQGWLDEVVAAHRRLLFTPFKPETLPSRKAEEDVKYFEGLIATAEYINTEVSRIKQECRSDISAFRDDALESGQADFVCYARLLEHIIELGAQAREINTLFPDENDIQKRLREIRLSTPPETPEPNE